MTRCPEGDRCITHIPQQRIKPVTLVRIVQRVSECDVEPLTALIPEARALDLLREAAQVLPADQFNRLDLVTADGRYRSWTIS